MANATEPDDDLLNTFQAGAPAELLADSVGDYVRILGKRVRSGESGALPVIVGLVVIVIFFWVKSPAFITPRNLVNLMTQFRVHHHARHGRDLRAAARRHRPRRRVHRRLRRGHHLVDARARRPVVGRCHRRAGRGGRLRRAAGEHHGPARAAVLRGNAGRPVGLSGLLLYLVDQTGSIGTGGEITLHNTVINAIEGSQLSSSWTWIVMIVIAVLSAFMIFFGDYRRRTNGLIAAPMSIIWRNTIRALCKSKPLCGINGASHPSRTCHVGGSGVRASKCHYWH